MEHPGDETDPRDEAQDRVERIERLLRQLRSGERKKRQFTLEKFADPDEKAEFFRDDFRPKTREKRPSSPPQFGPSDPSEDFGAKRAAREIDIEIPFYPQLAPRAAKNQRILSDKDLKSYGAELTTKLRTELEKVLQREALKTQPQEIILVNLNIGIYVREIEENKQGITIVKERVIIHRFVMAYDPHDSGAAE